MPEVGVNLIGGFSVTWRDVEVEIAASARRLVAFLALHGRSVERSFVANCLWPDKREVRAQANLRSSLWRLRQSDVPIVEASGTVVGLTPTVCVDLVRVVAYARRLIDTKAEVAENELDESALVAELLPEWYDDFVQLERERLHQLRLHGLEALARRLQQVGLAARAVDVALTAVAVDPLRESAHRTLIEVHLSEGNQSEALRQYERLHVMLRDQLGVEPSAAVYSLVAPLLGRQVASLGSRYPFLEANDM